MTLGTKCKEYVNDIHPSDLTAEQLCERINFGDNPYVIEGFRRWLAILPKEMNITVSDLVYWEQKHGIWGSCGLTLRETITDPIPPMNCREFIEMGLSTGVESRKSPYPLIHHMIQITEPKLLEYPFNHDWVDSWQGSIIGKTPLPWRVKKMLKLVNAVD